MVVEDKKHSEAVRTRIDMIVDAQEAGGNVLTRRQKSSNKLLILILSICGVVIVGLVVAILFVVKPWEYYEEGDSRIVRLCYYNSKTTEELVKCVEENHGEDSILDSYREIIAKRISKIENYTVAAGAEAYEDIINVLDGEDQVRLLMDRIRWILLNDDSNELGEAALKDALAVFELEPDATSANTVMVVAKRYDYEEAYNEYEVIFNDYVEKYDEEDGIG